MHDATKAQEISARAAPVLTGQERQFPPEQIIVTKTDLSGRITYANRNFLQIADYREEEVIGQSHSFIRHPDMPRSIFRLMWETISQGGECFAYVVNRARNGDHYWVLAHVTPTRNAEGAVVGYHSNRRCPRRDAIARIMPLYADLRAIERAEPPQGGLEDARSWLTTRLQALHMPYDEFVLSL